MDPDPIRALFALAGLLAMIGMAAFFAARADSQPKPEIGLMTGLPIYWTESGGLSLDQEDDKHWVRNALESRFSVRLLDTLERESLTFAANRKSGLQALILAQPRVLQPAEFVALDDWVRSGGRAVIFADPMLTEHSHYSLTDPRRPPLAAALSPILTRWGLRQIYDEGQPGGARQVSFAGGLAEVDAAGQFEPLSDAQGRRDCTISDAGLVAHCRIGAGLAILIADAHILSADADQPINRAALERVLAPLLD